MGDEKNSDAEVGTFVGQGKGLPILLYLSGLGTPGTPGEF